MATRGRVREVARFLEHLDRQSYRIFELIVVDQNDDDRLTALLRAAGGAFPLRHVTSSAGACHGRNTGLAHVTGEIVSFPDDDCWYPRECLSDVVERFVRGPGWDGVSGRCVEPDGRPAEGWDATAGEITRRNVWRRGITSAIFLHRHAVERVGKWDESIGPGSATGLAAGDETDYLLRALAVGMRLYYDPSIAVFHPAFSQYETGAGRERGYGYGRAMSAVLRKHHYPPWHIAYWCCRALGGALVWLGRGNVRRALFDLAVFRGRAREALRPTVRLN